MPTKFDKSHVSSIKAIIVLSLLIDLLAFTAPLPLFPRLIDNFVQREAFLQSPTVLSRSLDGLRAFRARLLPHKLSAFEEGIAQRHDVVLLGGAMGSLFSLCQWLTSPYIGSLADTYGRRPVLLVSMLGNIASGALWLFATDFGTYLASRAVGGMSECNVQLALASLADITPPEKRAQSMALVGIAFSVSFVTGPLLGARLASAKLPALPFLEPRLLNVYAFPAAMTIGLLVLETLILAAFLPETMQTSDFSKKRRIEPNASSKLAQLEQLHLNFLFVFSGVEFTLTFLCFDLFGYTNREQGALLATMGLFAAFLQGTVVRRGRLSPRQLVMTGLASCTLSLSALALLPIIRSRLLLRLAAACLAVTSATVVTSLTAMASTKASAEEQGAVLGRFRSQGQLGRALGPIAAVTLYWSAGPTQTYALAAAGMLSILATSVSGVGALAEPINISKDE